jgi:hypothetical protein
MDMSGTHQVTGASGAPDAPYGSPHNTDGRTIDQDPRGQRTPRGP